MKSRVPRACARCKRQKLKCDPFRPCALCVRSEVECKSVEVDPWRPIEFSAADTPQTRSRTSTNIDNADTHQPSKRQKRTNSSPKSDDVERNKIRHVTPAFEDNINDGDGEGEKDSRVLYDRESSMFGLTKEAFDFHNSSETLQPNLTSAILGAERTPTATSPQNSGSAKPQTATVTSSLWRKPRTSVAELVALLPSLPETRFLVDVYFDKVHWFKMTFHQEVVRAEFNRIAELNYIIPNTEENFSFVCVLLAVVVLAAPYSMDLKTGEPLSFNSILPRAPLNGHPITFDVNELVLSITEKLKSVFLEIVSIGNLHSLQVCVLLGSYCLYQGDPGLAWTIIGCGIRIAQALCLHREPPKGLPWREAETRRRAWWSIYNFDRLTACMYGRPMGISDSDCDVSFPDEFANVKLKNWKGPVDEFDPKQLPMPPGDVDGHFKGDNSTLLSYGVKCSELNQIVGEILTKFYNHNRTRNVPQSRKSRFQQLLMDQKEMDKKLKKWHDGLPRKLVLDEHAKRKPPLNEDGSVRREYHAFQMQSLAMQLLVYENAVILLHRPFLTYKLTHPIPKTPPTGKKTEQQDPFTYSANKCREAALRTSRIAEHSIFRYAKDTDAVAHMGIQLFSSGVILCLAASQDCLSMAAIEAKAGVQRILETMQTGLGRRSVVIDQGVRLLKELIGAVLRRELESLVGKSDTNIEEDQLFRSGEQNRHVVENPSTTSSSAMDVPISSTSTSNNGSNNFDFLFDTQWEFPPFAENENLNQTLSEFEKVMADANVRTSTMQAQTTDDTAAPVSDNGFIEQEQAWIWNFDPLRDDLFS